MNDKKKFGILVIILCMFSLAYAFSSIDIDLKPNDGFYNTYIDIQCEDNLTSHTNITYYIEGYFNDTINGYGWYNISSNSSTGNYTWIITEYPDQNNVSLRCRLYNFSSNDFSIYYNITDNITIKKNNYVKLFYSGFTKDYYSREMLPFSIGCNLENNNNLYIEYSYIDCNGDGLWDYTNNYQNLTLQKTLDSHNCYYKTSDNYTMSAGCIIKKYGNSASWGDGICENIPDDKDMCNIENRYVIDVR